MKIKNMRQPNEEGQWGKVKAFFDVENSGFEMKGFRLVEGINGLFVSMPSRKGTDENGNDKWFDTIWIESRDVREQLNTLALAEYNSAESTNSDMMQSDQNSEPAPNPTAETTTGDNIKSDNINSESTTPAFSDEDIPF